MGNEGYIAVCIGACSADVSTLLSLWPQPDPKIINQSRNLFMKSRKIHHILASHTLLMAGVRHHAIAASASLWQPSAMAILVAGALCASVAVQAQTQSEAARLQWNIQAQPLVSALRQFASDGQQQLLFDEARLEPLRSSAVSGTYTAAEALGQLLKGTGVVAIESSQNVFTLRLAPVERGNLSQARALDEVVVSAAAGKLGLTESTGAYTTDNSSSATGLNLSLRETPQSVSVMTRKRMEDQNLTSFNDVMDQAVGITRWNSGDSETGYSGYYARGFQINSYQVDGAITAPGSMGGFRGQSGLGSRDMAIFDQVTIVRGATGLLTGSGTPSASINLVRKRPTKDFQGHVMAQASRWSRYRGEADISGALTSDGAVRGRLVAVHADNESWAERASNKKTTLYGVLETDLGSNTTLYGGVEYFRMRAKESSMHGFEYANTAGERTNLSGFDNPATKSSYDNVDRTILFANLEHNFANGWQAKAEINQTRVDADKLYGVATGTVQAGTNASSVTYGKSLNKPKQNGLDVRLSGPYSLFGREHELVAGLNYYKLKRDDPAYARHYNVPVDNIYEYDGSTPYDQFVFSGRSKEDARQLGVFLATHLRPTDNLSFVLGGRLSNYKATSSNLDESGVFTPYAGMTYDFTSQWSAYASYTTIFTPQSQQDVNGNTLDPQEGTNVELGLKAELLDGRLNASAALFQTKADNLAVADGTNLTPEGNQAYIALNDTTSKGWELEVSGQIMPRWQVSGGYTRVVTRDTNNALLNTDTVPEHQFKLFTSYRFGGSLSGLTLGGGLNWQNKVYVNNARYSAAHLALYQEKARTLVSLMARYQFTPNLDLALNLENATDKRYRASNLTLHNIGAPRNLTASLKYRF